MQYLTAIELCDVIPGLDALTLADLIKSGRLIHTKTNSDGAKFYLKDEVIEALAAIDKSKAAPQIMQKVINPKAQKTPGGRFKKSVYWNGKKGPAAKPGTTATAARNSDGSINLLDK